MSESELEYRSGALKLEHGLHNIGHTVLNGLRRVRVTACACPLLKHIARKFGQNVRTGSIEFSSRLFRSKRSRHTSAIVYIYSSIIRIAHILLEMYHARLNRIHRWIPFYTGCSYVALDVIPSDPIVP